MKMLATLAVIFAGIVSVCADENVDKLAELLNQLPQELDVKYVTPYEDHPIFDQAMSVIHECSAIQKKAYIEKVLKKNSMNSIVAVCDPSGRIYGNILKLVEIEKGLKSTDPKVKNAAEANYAKVKADYASDVNKLKSVASLLQTELADDNGKKGGKKGKK